jgi:hypothetical protein
MNQPLPPDSEFIPLLNAACDGILDDARFELLETALVSDPSFRKLFASHVQLLADMELLGRAEKACNSSLARVQATLPQESASMTPVPVFDLHSAHASPAGYFFSGWPVAYLVATVIFGIGLIVGALVHVSQPAQVVTPSVPHLSPVIPRSSAVAHITGMVECQWEKRSWFGGQDSEASNHQSDIINQKSLLHVGDRLALRSGLLELTYETGAKVILQGPVTYEVESPSGGYLSVGKLTAKLEKKPEVKGQRSESANQKAESRNQKSPDLCPLTSDLFAIRTPTAIVTDLGTEFGVEVDGQGGTTSHVFRGLVRFQATSGDGTANGAAEVLHESQSARVDIPNRRPTRIPMDTNVSSGFVREISKKTASALAAFETIACWRFEGDDFLADSSGHGHRLVNHGATQVDEAAAFDGKAMMSTVDSIDLTPYKRIRVSWRQKTVLPDSDQVVWEHGSDFNAMPGAFAIVLAKGKAHAGIRSDDAPVGDGDNRDTFNVDQYPLLTNEWETLAVEFDRTAYRANVVRVFKDGAEIPTTTFFDGFGPKSFVNAAFHIGARDGLKAPFTGQIDDLKIEGEITTNKQ